VLLREAWLPPVEPPAEQPESAKNPI